MNILERGVIIRYIKKVFLIIGLFFIGSVEVLANNSYSYTYDGVEKWGIEVGGDNTAIINLIDEEGNIYNTYCIDHDTSVKSGHNYSIVNIEDSGYVLDDVIAKIRNIVKNAYPFIGIDYVREISKIDELSEEEAISGTQAAIWHYANGYNFELDGNVKTLYDFYLSFSDSDTISTDIADLNISYDFYFDDNIRNVLIKVDSSNISELEYSFNIDLAEYGITEESVDNGILLKNVPVDLEFEVSVSGKQTILNDVYFYYPEGGVMTSQSLVGVNSGVVSVSNKAMIKVIDKGNLIIRKIDSFDSKLIGDAKIGIYSDEECTKLVEEIETIDGKENIVKLPVGNYCVKEIEAPDGYILNLDNFKVNVLFNEESSLEIFNHRIYDTDTNHYIIFVLEIGLMIVMLVCRIGYELWKRKI